MQALNQLKILAQMHQSQEVHQEENKRVLGGKQKKDHLEESLHGIKEEIIKNLRKINEDLNFIFFVQKPAVL